MRIFLYILVYFILVGCASMNKFSTKKNRNGDLIGIVTKSDFQQEPYGSKWFNDFYSWYEVDQPIVEEIKQHLKGITIKGFLGTWCSDSQREVPNFYKLLDNVNFNYKKLKLIAVDKDKKAGGLEKKYKLEKVPTFIFYKNGKEIGRFVEYAPNNSTIEKDILTIISGKPYKHPYQK